MQEEPIKLTPEEFRQNYLNYQKERSIKQKRFDETVYKGYMRQKYNKINKKYA